jgi:hypothetical protein
VVNEDFDCHFDAVDGQGLEQNGRIYEEILDEEEDDGYTGDEDDGPNIGLDASSPINPNMSPTAPAPTRESSAHEEKKDDSDEIRKDFSEFSVNGSNLCVH